MSYFVGSFLYFRNIKLKTPYEVRRDADKLHFTYLDTVGRPVVTLHKDNLVEQHIQDFEADCSSLQTTDVAFLVKLEDLENGIRSVSVDHILSLSLLS